MLWTVADIASATSGQRVGGDPEGELTSVAIDSRTLRGGELFVAIRAQRDGHRYVPDAVAAGARAVLVDRRWRREAVGSPAIGEVCGAGVGVAGLGVGSGAVAMVEVDDSSAALLAVGRAARRRLQAPVIGITGSVGKTSTKDLTAAALAPRWRTSASEKSFNNEIGVPLTLANAPEDAEVVVIEMGARGPGHISLLCDVARPVLAVVTAVAAVHTEMFGSVAGVAAAKGELVEALPAGGTAVLNADDPFVVAMSERAASGVSQLRFSALGDASADVIATDVSVDDELRARFVLVSPWGTVPVALAARGEHQVANALAAATVALCYEVPLADVAAALGSATLSPWRMALGRAPSGAVVLNDAYNANPASMEAALRSLARLPATRHVAVVGEMAELGDLSPSAHRRVAEIAGELGVELLVVGTTLYGPDPVADIDAAVAVLQGGPGLQAGPGLGPDVAVLVKASRVAGLERLAERLTDRLPGGC